CRRCGWARRSASSSIPRRRPHGWGGTPSARGSSTPPRYAPPWQAPTTMPSPASGGRSPGPSRPPSGAGSGPPSRSCTSGERERGDPSVFDRRRWPLPGPAVEGSVPPVEGDGERGTLPGGERPVRLDDRLDDVLRLGRARDVRGDGDPGVGPPPVRGR